MKEIINRMQQSPSSNSSHSTGRDTPRHLRKQKKVQCHVYKIPPLGFILSQIHPIRIIVSSLFKKITNDDDSDNDNNNIDKGYHNSRLFKEKGMQVSLYE
jgi:hypothetical protein